MSLPIAERLRSADPDERRAACQDAAHDPEAASCLDDLVHALGDPELPVARSASDALAELGRHVEGVKRLLREALHSAEPARRVQAAFTLARLEPPSPGLLPVLVQALSSHEGSVRWAAARLLVDTGRLHGEVLTLLLGLVRSSEQALVRRMASFCLRELAPDRPEASRVLLEATRDPALGVRRAAFTALAGLIEPSHQVRERLLEALEHDPDPAIRRIAAAVLAELGTAEPGALDSETTARLVAVRDRAEDPELRRATERALARLGRERHG